MSEQAPKADWRDTLHLCGPTEAADVEKRMLRREAADRRQQRLDAARSLGTHSVDEWRRMLRAAGGDCPRCGEQNVRLQKDHIVPLYAGGSDRIDNIQPICGPCNSSKGAERVDWFAEWRTPELGGRA